MTRLEEFVQALGGEMRQAQAACGQRWGQLHIASMEVAVAATIEPVDALGTFALRIGGAVHQRQAVHQLCIVVPGSGQQAITAHLDGCLLGRYWSMTHDQP